MLQNNDGIWITEAVQLEKLVTDYYKEIFNDDGFYLPLGVAGVLPNIDEGELHDLERLVTKEEIFQTLRRMGSFKAPGPDRYQAIFFQKQ